MKKHILSIALTGLLFTACQEKPQGEVAQDQAPATEEVDATATNADSLPPAVKPEVIEKPAEGDILTVTGEVFEINQGKDGYSAKMKNAEGRTYVATISIPNMANPKDYRAVKKGETITVTGEVFPLEEDVIIKVTKLH